MAVIGYLPQEILGISCYEYFHQGDLRRLAEKHRQGDGAEQPQSAFLVTNLYLCTEKKSNGNERMLRCDDNHVDFFCVLLAVLRSKEKIETPRYRFKTKHGSYVVLESQWSSFRNPWTKEVEFIVSLNRLVS